MVKLARGTVRSRVTALAAVVMVVVLAGTAVGLVTAQRAQLTTNLDANLEQRAEDIANLLDVSDVHPDELGASTREGFAQFVGDDGMVITSTPNLAGSDPLPLALEPDRVETIRTVGGLDVDDDAFRVLTRRVSTTAGSGLLHVGATYDDVTESIAALTTSLAVVIPIGGVLLAGLVWWLLGRTLAPVERIRSQVARIGEGNLDRRVPRPAGDDEIARLADTMNDMLGRVEHSVAAQQRFVADASHELRSPLTRIRTQLDVHAARPPDDETRAAIRSTLDDVVALQHLVEDLLHLARADAGRQRTIVRPVDLDDLVLREVRRVREGGRATVDISWVSAAQTTGDPYQLTRAIRNLVENAERHAAGSIVVTLGEADGDAVLTVTDDGPGIPADQQERVFERFARLDDARSPGSGGTGLGLAITREIVERHGGRITVSSGDHGGARFVLTLPAAG